MRRRSIAQEKAASSTPPKEERKRIEDGIKLIEEIAVGDRGRPIDGFNHAEDGKRAANSRAKNPHGACNGRVHMRQHAPVFS